MIQQCRPSSRAKDCSIDTQNQDCKKPTVVVTGFGFMIYDSTLRQRVPSYSGPRFCITNRSLLAFIPEEANFSCGDEKSGRWRSDGGLSL